MKKQCTSIFFTNFPALHNDVQTLPQINLSNHQCLLFAPKLKDKFIGVARKVPIEHHQAINATDDRQRHSRYHPRTEGSTLMQCDHHA